MLIMAPNLLIAAGASTELEILGTNAQAANASTRAAMALPAGTADGDLLFVSSASGNSVSSSLISGFAQRGLSGKNEKQLVQSLLFAAPPPASYNNFQPASGTNPYVSGMIALRNAAIDVVGALSTNRNGPQNILVDGVTVSEDSCILLLFAAGYDESNNIAAPAGFTQSFQANFAGSRNPHLAVFYKEVNAGATGSVALVFPDNNTNASGQLISIKQG